MPKLNVKIVEKVWGVRELPFPVEGASDEPIGEIWFMPPEELPDILVKHIFTSENLSVQVHPDDRQARQLGLKNTGKDECWFITAAEDDAELAIGFDRDVSTEEIRTMALDGSIIDVLTWHRVAVGDFFFIPAGTVHAIGAGVSLVEVQQNSNATFRLFDYGRPRELHLDKGLRVAKGCRYPKTFQTKVNDDGSKVELLHSSKFCVELSRNPGADIRRPALILPLEGEIRHNGSRATIGDCVLMIDHDELILSDDAIILVVTAGRSASA